MAISATALVSEETYRRIAIGGESKRVELVRGRPREQPAAAFSPTQRWFEPGIMPERQLDRDGFVVGVNGGRLRRSTTNVAIPDVFVTPTAVTRPLRTWSDGLALDEEPLPLVVEVRSPSTGNVDEKFTEYRARGDLEIYRLHLSERTPTAWRRRPDGGEDGTPHREGIIRPASPPGVATDLGDPFAVIG